MRRAESNQLILCYLNILKHHGFKITEGIDVEEVSHFVTWIFLMILGEMFWREIENTFAGQAICVCSTIVNAHHPSLDSCFTIPDWN
jgi:hypothetical protein